MGTKALSALWSVKLCCSIRTSSSHHFSCVNNHTHMRFGRCTKHIHLQCIHMQSHIIQRGAQHCPHPSFDHTLIYRPSLQWQKKKDTSHRKGGSLSSQRGASSSHMPPLLYLLPQSPSLLFPLGPARCIHTNWISHDSNALLGLSGTNTH